MPFNEMKIEDSRLALCIAVEEGSMNVSEAARWQGVSRKTAHLWLNRFRSGAALHSRSRARLSQGGQTPAELEERIIALREENPGRGPRKIRVLLKREFEKVPADSTIGAILKRAGMVHPRRRRRRIQPYTRPFMKVEKPNDLWTIDFKGWFTSGDGARCEPLTLQDAQSRFLLEVEIVPSTSKDYARPILTRAFKKYGLPKAIRSDNGTPFATPTSRLGLSELSVWWTQLGIQHERIAPGKPQQNGRHERMHGVMKAYIKHRKPKTARQARRVLKDFVHDYNIVRPHQSLDMKTPDSCYQKSKTELRKPQTDFAYPKDWIKRRVFVDGKFSWKNKDIFISRTLKNTTIGLEPLGAERFRVHHGNAIVAIFEAHTQKILTTNQRPRRPKVLPM